MRRLGQIEAGSLARGLDIQLLGGNSEVSICQNLHYDVHVHVAMSAVLCNHDSELGGGEIMTGSVVTRLTRNQHALPHPCTLAESLGMCLSSSVVEHALGWDLRRGWAV